MDNLRSRSCPRLPRAAKNFVVNFRKVLSRFDDIAGMGAADGRTLRVGPLQLKKLHL